MYIYIYTNNTIDIEKIHQSSPQAKVALRIHEVLIRFDRDEVPSNLLRAGRHGAGEGGFRQDALGQNHQDHLPGGRNIRKNLEKHEKRCNTQWDKGRINWENDGKIGI